MEMALTRIWGELLNKERIGVLDNFFDLGGHSLLALCVISQVAKRLGKSVDPSALLQAPTIEQFANFLDHQELSSRSSSLISLQPGGSKPPFFWVHGDYSNALLHRYLDTDQPV